MKINQIAQYVPKSIRLMIRNSLLFKFYLRRSLLRGGFSTINLELTNKCNARCRMCPRPQMKDWKVDDMDFELFKRVVNEVKPLAKASCTFSLTGLGEPLINPMLPKSIEYIKKEFPKCSINLNTNGILLDEKWSKVLVKLLGKEGRILFSLNTGSEKSYKWLMGVDRYEKTVLNIKRFLNIRKNIQKSSKPTVIIQILNTNRTLPEVEKFKKYWESLLEWNDEVLIRPLANWAGKVNISKIGHTKKFPKRFPCLHLWSTVSVDMEGNLYPCCMGFSIREKSDFLIGNISKKSLRHVYLSKIWDFRDAHLTNNYSNLIGCLKCDHCKFMPNLFFRNWFGIGDKKWF